MAQWGSLETKEITLGGHNMTVAYTSHFPGPPFRPIAPNAAADGVLIVSVHSAEIPFEVQTRLLAEFHDEAIKQITG